MVSQPINDDPSAAASAKVAFAQILHIGGKAP
jgi:hypothetical protein